MSRKLDIETEFSREERKISANIEEPDMNFETLDNNIKMKFINNFNPSKITVALDIHIGNFCDPPHFPGLAHLCQRVITFGSKAHSGRFLDLLRNNNGKIILTTSLEHSTFYFHIDINDSSVFEEILVNFAQIFTILPDLEDDCIVREIHTIDLMLKKKLEHNWFRYFEKSLADSAHPYSQYDLCKKKILMTMPMEEIKLNITNFLVEYYSARIMTLYIVGEYTPNKNRRIKSIFSNIENANIFIPKSIFENPFKNKSGIKWYIALKNNDVSCLRLSFYLDDEYWYRAIRCISFFLEYNGKNSLLDILKTNNWCSNISTAVYKEANNLNFYHIVITLLPEGCKYIDDIILLFFEYLKLFKFTYLPTDYKQDQLRTILYWMLKYKRFHEIEQMTTELKIIKTVQQMHKYSPEHVTNLEYYKGLDFTILMINTIINTLLSPACNFRVYVINCYCGCLPRTWEANVNYEEYEIQKSLINLWLKPLEFPSQLVLPNLECMLDVKKPLYSETFPEIIKDTLFVKSWYIYATPSTIPQQIKMLFHFISPHTCENPLTSLLNAICVEMLTYRVRSLQDVPDFNKFQCFMTNTNYGILLEIISYIDLTYHTHLSKVFSTILKSNEIDPAGIEILSSIKDIKSFRKDIPPEERATSYVTNLLSENSWTFDEVLETSPSVTTDKFKEFTQKFLNNLRVKCLIYGKTNRLQALEIAENVELEVKKASKVSTNTSKKLLQHRHVKLKNDIHLLYEAEHNYKYYNDVSCILVYFPIGIETVQSKLKVALICYIMTEKCSTYFKNIQHIYQINVCQRNRDGIQGLEITIATSMNPFAVQYHINRFIFYIMSQLYWLSRKDFVKYKKEFIENCSKTNLFDISSALWLELNVSTFTILHCSNLRKMEEELILNINQESLFTFYKENICDKNATLSVHMLPNCKNKSGKQDLSDSSDSSYDSSDLSVSSQSEQNTSPEKAASKFKSKASKIYKPSTSARPAQQSFGSKINETITSVISKYKEKIKSWYNVSLSEAQFTKINDILLFKQTQEYYG